MVPLLKRKLFYSHKEKLHSEPTTPLFISMNELKYESEAQTESPKVTDVAFIRCVSCAVGNLKTCEDPSMVNKAW